MPKRPQAEQPATPPAPAHLNPFFIEPNDDFDSDEAYDDFDPEEDVALLLSTKRQRQQQQRRSRSAVPHLAYDTTAQMYARWICWSVLVIFIGSIFWLSYHGQQGDSRGSGESGSANKSKTTPARPGPVTGVVLLGESEEMIEWFKKKLGICLPSVQVSSGLNRPGHLLQDPPRDLDSFQSSGSSLLPVVLMTDPYSSAEYYRTEYMHAPNHRSEDGSPLEWRDFVTKQWTTMDLPEADKSMTLQQKRTPGVCRYHFDYGRIVPCHEMEGDRDPTYEQRRDESPFQSVLELRKAHVENFLLQVPAWYGNVTVKPVTWFLPAASSAAAVRRAHVELYKSVADAFALKANATCDGVYPHLPSASGYPHEFVRYINKHTDWNVERNLGSLQRTWDDLQANLRSIGAGVQADKEEQTKENQSNGENEEAIDGESKGKKAETDEGSKSEESGTKGGDKTDESPKEDESDTVSKHEESGGKSAGDGGEHVKDDEESSKPKESESKKEGGDKTGDPANQETKSETKGAGDKGEPDDKEDKDIPDDKKEKINGQGAKESDGKTAESEKADDGSEQGKADVKKDAPAPDQSKVESVSAKDAPAKDKAPDEPNEEDQPIKEQKEDGKGDRTR